MSVIDRQTKRQTDRPGDERIRKCSRDIISQSSHFKFFMWSILLGLLELHILHDTSSVER